MLKYLLALLLLMPHTSLAAPSAPEKTPEADSVVWGEMPAGARTTYIGIHGGTVPVSLLSSGDGSPMIALVGLTGNDFVNFLRQKGRLQEELVLPEFPAQDDTAPKTPSLLPSLTDTTALLNTRNSTAPLSNTTNNEQASVSSTAPSNATVSPAPSASESTAPNAVSTTVATASTNMTQPVQSSPKTNLTTPSGAPTNAAPPSSRTPASTPPSEAATLPEPSKNAASPDSSSTSEDSKESSESSQSAESRASAESEKTSSSTTPEALPATPDADGQLSGNGTLPATVPDRDQTTLFLADTNSTSAGIPVIYATGSAFERMSLIPENWKPFGLTEKALSVEGKVTVLSTPKKPPRRRSK